VVLFGTTLCKVWYRGVYVSGRRMITSNKSIRKLADLIQESRKLAVLTGAGMSTASGIPDFRSVDGFYSDARNANVFEFDVFERDPSFYYKFAQRFYPIVEQAQPNAGHRILASWEKRGLDVEIATQNIDDLHQRAGSKKVYPVHGTVETSSCLQCGHRCKTQMLHPRILANEIPRCSCGGVYKPDITFFGEALPEEAWTSSVTAMTQADLVLVLGSSLVVYPAASLPLYRHSSARLAIINRDETPLDMEADYILHQDLSEALTAIEQLVLN
jgi:NAD-dependent deacetylase